MLRTLAVVSLLALAPIVSARAQSTTDKPAEPAAAEPIVLHKAAAPPEIDGKLDDACWKNAVVFNVDHVHGAKPPRQADKPPMTCRYTWDDRYLYIAYEIFDANLIAQGTGQKQGPPGNQREGAVIYNEQGNIDLVEFFIGFDDPRFFWEIHHNAFNQFNDVWCVYLDPKWPVSKAARFRWGISFNHEEYIEDEGDYTLKTAVALKPGSDGKPSRINDASVPGAGYTAEIRLPWWGLNTPIDRQTTIRHPATQPGGREWTEPGPWKMAGATMSILAVVQNPDLKDRYHRANPTGPDPWFHKDFPNYPRFILKD